MTGAQAFLPSVAVGDRALPKRSIRPDLLIDAVFNHRPVCQIALRPLNHAATGDIPTLIPFRKVAVGRQTYQGVRLLLPAILLHRVVRVPLVTAERGDVF